MGLLKSWLYPISQLIFPHDQEYEAEFLISHMNFGMHGNCNYRHFLSTFLEHFTLTLWYCLYSEDYITSLPYGIAFLEGGIHIL